MVADLGDQIPWPVRTLGRVEGEFGAVEESGDGVDGFACCLDDDHRISDTTRRLQQDLDREEAALGTP
ncbi:hypothetical protein ACWC9T_14285 [Kitasatospora sp. NPDC001159]